MANILRNTIISVLIVGLVFTVFFSFATNLADNYQVNVNENESMEFSIINSTTQRGYELSQSLESASENMTRGGISGVASGIYLYSESVYKVIKMPIQALGDVNNIITSTGKVVGIPNYAIYTIYAIIVIIIAYAIANAILGRND
jgi:hypothetical protein